MKALHLRNPVNHGYWGRKSTPRPGRSIDDGKRDSKSGLGTATIIYSGSPITFVWLVVSEWSVAESFALGFLQ